MPELFRAAAFGLIASLMAATSAFAIEASSASVENEADNQQAVELVSAGVTAKAAGDPNCPSVTLAPDGDSRKSDGAKATLDALARDCANLGAETIVKVGMVGEGSRRKKGDADQIDAPITIQIKDGEGHDIEVRKVNLKVEMPEGVQKVSFQHVEENVSLPPPSADGYAKWTIVVGLDPASPGEAADDVASVDEQAEEPVATIVALQAFGARLSLVEVGAGRSRALRAQQPLRPPTHRNPAAGRAGGLIGQAASRARGDHHHDDREQFRFDLREGGGVVHRASRQGDPAAGRGGGCSAASAGRRIPAAAGPAHAAPGGRPASHAARRRPAGVRAVRSGDVGSASRSAGYADQLTMF